MIPRGGHFLPMPIAAAQAHQQVGGEDAGRSFCSWHRFGLRFECR